MSGEVSTRMKELLMALTICIGLKPDLDTVDGLISASEILERYISTAPAAPSSRYFLMWST